MRILIVEDVESMRHLLAHVLGGIPGLHVSGLASNGWEARLETQKHRPDLVLLDEVLPGESVSDLIELYASEKIPVVLITGMSDPCHKIPAGTLGRLSKPSWKTIESDRKRYQSELLKLVSG